MKQIARLPEGSLTATTPVDGSKPVLKKEDAAIWSNGNLVECAFEPKYQVRPGMNSITSVIEELAEEFPDIEENMRDGRSWVADTFFGNEKSLKAIRLRAGLSQTELAIRAGSVQPSIARYESGTEDPRASTIKRLAEALGIDPAELFNVMVGK